MYFETGIARHGIALAAFANQFQNYHRAPVAHRQKVTENVIIPLLYSFAWLNIAVTSSARNLAMEVCQEGGRQRLDFKSSSLPATGKASMRELACSPRVEPTARKFSIEETQTSCRRIPASGTTLSLSQPRRAGRIPNDVQSHKINLITLHIRR